jgi:DNA-binding transcriptional LysR family regulator
MDRLKSIQTFTRVASTASFSKAAELLGMSRGAVSRQISELETHLGVPLLRRNTRHVSLTESGERYFRECSDILRRLDQAEHDVTGMQHSLSGSLKILAKRTFGVLHLSAAVADFSESYPEIEVCTVLDDQLSDMSKLLDDSFDVAIRISPLPDSSLKARKLAVLRWLVCATPAYLKDKGTPFHPQDLQRHNCLYHLHHSVPARSAEWAFKGPGGSVKVRVTGGPSANNVMCLRSAALKGLGVTLLPTYCIGDDLAAGRLVPLLEQFQVESRALYAIYPSRETMPRKVKTFVGFLQERYRRPAWDHY